MDTKLTLKLDESIIQGAKGYAEKNDRSLSDLVENYFRMLVRKERNGEEQLLPAVREISGVFSIGKKTGPRQQYADYLKTKYSR